MYEIDSKWNQILHKLNIKKSPYIENRIWKYEKVANQAINHAPKVDYKRFWGITPQWDNTARRKENAVIFHDSTPEKYEHWLRHIKNNFKPYSKDENIFFINAWNEWAEGCHLEPDRKYGRQFLEATQRALNKSSDLKNFTDKAIFEIKNRKFLTDLKEFTSYHTSLLFRELRSYISKYPRLKAVLIIPIRLLIRLNSSRS
jgi:hypothetical protein